MRTCPAVGISKPIEVLGLNGFGTFCSRRGVGRNRRHVGWVRRFLDADIVHDRTGHAVEGDDEEHVVVDEGLRKQEAHVGECRCRTAVGRGLVFLDLAAAAADQEHRSLGVHVVGILRLIHRHAVLEREQSLIGVRVAGQHHVDVEFVEDREQERGDLGNVRLVGAGQQRMMVVDEVPGRAPGGRGRQIGAQPGELVGLVVEEAVRRIERDEVGIPVVERVVVLVVRQAPFLAEILLRVHVPVVVAERRPHGSIGEQRLPGLHQHRVVHRGLAIRVDDVAGQDAKLGARGDATDHRLGHVLLPHLVLADVAGEEEGEFSVGSSRIGFEAVVVAPGHDDVVLDDLITVHFARLQAGEGEFVRGGRNRFGHPTAESRADAELDRLRCGGRGAPHQGDLGLLDVLQIGLARAAWRRRSSARRQQRARHRS